MPISREEKAANRAALLTVVSILALGCFFPLVTFGYLATALTLTLLSNTKEFSALVVLFLPVTVIYCGFLALNNHKQVIAHCKAKVQEVVKHFV